MPPALTTTALPPLKAIPHPQHLLPSEPSAHFSAQGGLASGWVSLCLAASPARTEPAERNWTLTAGPRTSLLTSGPEMRLPGLPLLVSCALSSPGPVLLQSRVSQNALSLHCLLPLPSTRPHGSRALPTSLLGPQQTFHLAPYSDKLMPPQALPLTPSLEQPRPRYQQFSYLSAEYLTPSKACLGPDQALGLKTMDTGF